MASRKPRTAIGVGLSDARIIIAEIEASDSGYALLAYAAADLPRGLVEGGRITDADRFARFVRKAYEQPRAGAFFSSEVHIALPDLATYTHLFHFAGELSETEAADALFLETEEIIPVEPDRLHSDFFLAHRGEKETAAFQVSVEREVRQRYITAFREAGLKPASLRLEAQALYRALAGEASAQEGDTLVIDVAWPGATFYIADARGVRITSSQVLVGRRMRYGHLKKKKRLEKEEAAAQEKGEEKEKASGKKKEEASGKNAAAGGLLRSFGAAEIDALAARTEKFLDWLAEVEPGIAIGRVVLATEGGMSRAHRKRFKEAVAGRIGKAPVAFADPFANLAENEASRAVTEAGMGSTFAQAAGAAMCALNPDARTFDLLRPSRFETAGKGFSPRNVLSAVAGLFGEGGGRRTPMFAEPPKWIVFLRTRGGLVLSVILIALAAGALLWALFGYYQRQQAVEEEIQRLRGQDRPAETVAAIEAFEAAFTVSEDASGEDLPGRSFVRTGIIRQAEVVPQDARSEDVVITGDVTLINEGASAVTLVATTRLRSEEGVLYRLENEETVPAGGSVAAPVFADEAGPESAIEPGRLTIPGLPVEQQDDVYARAERALTGGEIVTGTLTQADIDRARAQAREEVRARAPAVFTDVLTGDFRTFPEWTAFTREEVTAIDAAVGDEISAATAEFTFDLRAFAYDRAALAERLRRQAEERSGAAVDFERDAEILVEPSEGQPEAEYGIRARVRPREEGAEGV